MTVCVYVEGGGPKAKSQTATDCRKGFRLFFEKVLGEGRKPRIVASGSRDEAHDDFQRSLKTDPSSFSLLIVDSEDPVPAGKTAAAHLQHREKHWKPLPNAQVGLMVPCMEAWFLADRITLAAYYGEGFKLPALPSNPKVEEVPKKDVLTGLANATKATQKGRYHKTKHGFELLGRIDPNKVVQSSPFADELVKLLLAKSR